MSEETTISFRCDCGQKLKAAFLLAGRQLKCPACGERTIVPHPAPPPETLPQNVFFVTPTFEVAEAVDESPPRLTRRRRQPRYGLLAAIITSASLLVGAIVVGSAYWLTRPPAPPKQLRVMELTDDDIGALAELGFREIQPVVLDALKAPATAVFRDTIDYKTWKDPAQNQLRLQIEGAVDAQNALGVPLRNKIFGVVILDLNTREWRVKDLLLGDTFLIQDAGTRLLSRYLAECEQFDRFYSSGDRTTDRFEIPTDWWRLQIETRADTRVEVLDSLDRVVEAANVEALGDRTLVIEKGGAFRLRVTSPGSWDCRVEIPE